MGTAMRMGVARPCTGSVRPVSAAPRTMEMVSVASTGAALSWACVRVPLRSSAASPEDVNEEEVEEEAEEAWGPASAVKGTVPLALPVRLASGSPCTLRPKVTTLRSTPPAAASRCAASTPLGSAMEPRPPGARCCEPSSDSGRARTALTLRRGEMSSAWPSPATLPTTRDAAMLPAAEATDASTAPLAPSSSSCASVDRRPSSACTSACPPVSVTPCSADAAASWTTRSPATT
mmetsp:Transcript_7484/g.21933  ORF Transcript_7484/g.21933 Transcript_7484/m.21933 type:complete len:234 (-) Transcript_7484:804-1505(-)